MYFLIRNSFFTAVLQLLIDSASIVSLLPFVNSADFVAFETAILNYLNQNGLPDADVVDIAAYVCY
jgi:hypothetical protein